MLKMMILGNGHNLNPNIELLEPQVYKNIAVVPLKTKKNYIDLLTLKKGFELGLVEVKECDSSQVNTLIVKNNAVTPLILVDGEEVVGGDQNRIVNTTILVAPKTEMKIPVSCSEKNRWAYKSKFKQSDYIANFNTRLAKESASRKSESFQDIVWSSIDELQEENNYISPTTAMEESYENLKLDHNKIINEFNIINGQTGILIIVDDEIKGFELFLNHNIYREFHEKILKSYIIDLEINDNPIMINFETIHEIFNNLYDSSFEKRENNGLEEVYTFENSKGIGTVYLFENNIIHWSYFAKETDYNNDEMTEDNGLKSDI